MRAVFVGASTLAVTTARRLLAGGHEVVIVDNDRERIDALSAELDCGFLHGDGSKPALLREADPQSTDWLFCLTGNDQTNILSSLVGRSLGFRRVVTKIEDSEFEHLCLELGLEDIIIPTRTIGRYLFDMFEGRDHMEIIALIKGEARAFSFVARAEDEKPIAELGLPEGSRVMFFYRDERFTLPEPDSMLKRGDEVMIVTHSRNLEALRARWRP
ncbi:MAG TPA: TrkA family potassium uptake protein [Thauera sp.]|uniref:potassium channel family protein n=1 Tax=Thauera sp. TaxID=1905334 RepID=UPI002D0691B1|nr:TrkA family potassium uptake protein [Thauera sp.]HRP24786.1 TrkA family potassium uptake protein [Thauera sp.]HRP65067.1 TrkA family potassium uptake protein [Thauera sp.]